MQARIAELVVNILVPSIKDKNASDVLEQIVGVVEVDLHRSISQRGKSQKVDLRLPDDGTIEGMSRVACRTAHWWRGDSRGLCQDTLARCGRSGREHVWRGNY